MIFSSLGSAILRRGFGLALLLLSLAACGAELALELQTPPELANAFEIPRADGKLTEGAVGRFNGESFLGGPNTDPRNVSCEASFGLFPPTLGEQTPFFQPYASIPYTLVESCFNRKTTGEPTKFLAAARLTDSWLCQYKKHAQAPFGATLYPSETWSTLLESSSLQALKTPRIGHQITALPDGRVVVSGGIAGKTDLLAEPFSSLRDKIINAKAFSAEVLLIDPHTTQDALRVQILGSTSRAYHQAFWNGANLVLMGGITADGASSAERWEIPPAGQIISTPKTPVGGGTDAMRRAFATAFPVERSGKIFAEQVGGVPIACLQATPSPSCATDKLLPKDCVVWPLPQDFSFVEKCGGIEDQIFLHQTTFLPKTKQGETQLLLSGGFVLLKAENTPSKDCTDLGNGAMICPNPYLVFLQINATGARNAYLTHLARYTDTKSLYTLAALFGHQTLYLGKHDLQLDDKGAIDTFLIAGGWSPFGANKGLEYTNLKIFGSNDFKFSHQVFLLQITNPQQAPILLPFDIVRSTAPMAPFLLRGLSSAAAFPTANSSQKSFGLFAGGLLQERLTNENAKSPFVRVDVSRDNFDQLPQEVKDQGILAFRIGPDVIRLSLTEMLSPSLEQRKAETWRYWAGAEGVRTATGTFLWFGGVFQPPNAPSTSQSPPSISFNPVASVHKAPQTPPARCILPNSPHVASYEIRRVIGSCRGGSRTARLSEQQQDVA